MLARREDVTNRGALPLAQPGRNRPYPASRLRGERLRQRWREHGVLEPLREFLRRQGTTEAELDDAAGLYELALAEIDDELTSESEGPDEGQAEDESPKPE